LESVRVFLRVGAVGDIHAPRFLDEFERCFSAIDPTKIDLFLFAGDLILKGNSNNLNYVLDSIERIGLSCPVLACFGNEEYSEIRDDVRKLAGHRIRFLDDESVELQVGKVRVGIVGSQGSLESPTPWQARNIPDIETTYSKRISKLTQLLTGLKSNLRILLIHYPPTFKILEGEPRMFYRYIGCRRCERILSKDVVDIVICAHSHMGSALALVNEVPVHNVSLPAVRKISEIAISDGCRISREVLP
jgi:Icc-related predicted phosphoesterase